MQPYRVIVGQHNVVLLRQCLQCSVAVFEVTERGVPREIGPMVCLVLVESLSSMVVMVVDIMFVMDIPISLHRRDSGTTVVVIGLSYLVGWGAYHIHVLFYSHCLKFVTLMPR